jgi:hypothetical protein
MIFRKHVLCALLLLPGLANGQQLHESRESLTEPEAIWRIERLGIRIGGAQYAGDVGDRADLHGTTTPKLLGVDILGGLDLFSFRDGLQSLDIGLEGSLGYRALRGIHPEYDFSTVVVPACISLDACLSVVPLFKPFFAAGAGILVYSVHQNRIGPEGGNPRQLVASSQGASVWFPLRTGLRISVSERLHFSTGIEYSITLADGLDGLVSNKRDWKYDRFTTLSVGASWLLRSGDSAPRFVEEFHEEKPVPETAPKLRVDFLFTRPPASWASDITLEIESAGKTGNTPGLSTSGRIQGIRTAVPRKSNDKIHGKPANDIDATATEASEEPPR